jgi:RHS repeat-associated protein
MVMTDRSGSLSNVEYRYGYNSKENDNEVKGEANQQDYGFRVYDPRVGRFLSVDPLAHKYPAISPYVYCYNNPISVIDPDGREGIVVSGSPGKHNNRNHFLDNGLDRAKAAQKHTQRKGEGVTWIVYNDKENGFTQKQLNNYKAKAVKAGVTMMVVSDVDDIVNYVNDKTGGDSRKNDQVTSFYYVGHSTPGDLDVGYQGTGENFEPDDFNSDAFSSGCHVNLVGGCRTAVSGVFEDSNVTQFSEILDNKSKVYGSDVRVDYWKDGKMTDAEILKTNKGKIVEKKGELPVKTE